MDLVTAEDVLEWLRFAPAADPVGQDYHACARIAVRLSAMLDRERRQACRRAALEAWRAASRMIRWCREASDGRVRHDADWAWADVGKSVWHSVYLALAFRAAARAK